MLKYLYVREIFSEIPSEIALGISISGCQIHCQGCHSRELWEDKGEPLNVKNLQTLMDKHKGITCVCLFGGEHNIDALTELFMYAHKRVKTAWYCGLDRLPKQHTGITQYLDFLKLGHFDIECGGLDSPTTNQRFYHLESDGIKIQWNDITEIFWKNRQQDHAVQR